MAPSTTGTTFEAATVEAAIAVDGVVATEGWPPGRRALGIGGAWASEGNIAAAAASANRTANAIRAVEAATALGSSGATTTLIPAAVAGAITGYPVIFAEDRPAGLATLTCGGTLTSKTDGPATPPGSAADTVCAAEPATADRVPITPTTIVMTAVQSTIGVNAVRCADRGPRCLTALPRLRTFGAECQPARSVVGADTVDAIQAATAAGAIVATCARATIISAAVQWAVTVITIVGTDCGAAGLTALLRRGALRTGSKPPRRRRSGRGATAGAINAKEVCTALNIASARTPGVATAIAGTIRRNAIAGTDD
jgi:hypothetical protein